MISLTLVHLLMQDLDDEKMKTFSRQYSESAAIATQVWTSH